MFSDKMIRYSMDKDEGLPTPPTPQITVWCSLFPN